jgi:hypothetical protein
MRATRRLIAANRRAFGTLTALDQALPQPDTDLLLFAVLFALWE